MALDYKTMKIEHIIAWCQANNQVEWLKATASQKTAQKVYPKVKNAEGKMVKDKTAKPSIVYTPISFIEIKTAFVEKFMPEIAPKKKEKKPTMYDIIANL